MTETEHTHSAPSYAHVVILSVATTVLLFGLIAGAFVLFAHHAQSDDPFASSRPSVSFPLYYSTKPPAGYSLQSGSVSQPHAGVVLFRLVKGTGKIVVTEEARTANMVNLGGFYKQFKDLHQIVESDGSIATGYFGNTEVASLANDQTWVLVTATNDVSFSQLSTMMQNLAISH